MDALCQLCQLSRPTLNSAEGSKNVLLIVLRRKLLANMIEDGNVAISMIEDGNVMTMNLLNAGQE